MANTPWLVLLTSILQRVRDPGGALHPQPLTTTLLTQLQWLLNAQGHFTLLTTTMTVQPHLPLYTLTEATGDNVQGPQGIIIAKVTHNNRPLDRLTLSQLTALDPNWFRAAGGRLEGFIQLGSTLLLLWPMLNEASTVQIISTALTPDLTQAGTSDLLSLPPEATQHLGQLLEALLLLRQRDMLAFSTLMKTLTGEPNAQTAPANI